MDQNTHNHLFARADLASTLEAYSLKAQEYVNKIPRDQFLASSDDELFEHTRSQFTVAPLVLHEEAKTASDEEAHKEAYSEFTETRLQIPSIRITVAIPYSGDSALWDLRPSSYYPGNFPFGAVRKSNKGEGGHLEIVIEQGLDEPEDRAKMVLESNLRMIREYLSTQKANIDAANARLEGLIRQAVRERRARLEKQDGVVKMLGIPLKPKDGAPDVTPIPLTRNIVKPLPPAPQGGYVPEYGITEAQYEQILAIVRHEGRTCETTPDTYAGFDEPDLRNMLLAHLNGHFVGGATGEAFRRKGKTDIRIEFESRAAFVAECKIWRGPKELADAIDQMLGYLTWRDCKCALIVYNKGQAKFSELLAKIPEGVKAHARFKQELKLDQTGEWRFLLTAKEDQARRIITHVLAFNLYTTPKRKS